MKHAVLFTGLLCAIGCTPNLAAQVGINSTGAPSNPEAALDLDYPDKGFLPPRVALTEVSDAAPFSTHTEGMVVYNTTTGGGLLPGLYVRATASKIEYFLDVGGIPGGIHSASSEALLVVLFSSDDIQGHFSDKVKILGGILLTLSAIVFSKNDIQYPVKRVFNSPVTSDGV
jgi:hypothetical protein